MFVELGGPDVSNGTFPNPLGLCGSTKVGFTSIQAFYFEILPKYEGNPCMGKELKDCFNISI